MNTSYNVTTAEYIDHALSRATWLLVDWLWNWPDRLRRNAEYRRAQAALESLSDAHLRDLGIHCRSDIPALVRGTAGRRPGL